MNENNDAMTDQTTDQLPDRLSTDPKSPYYNEAVLARDVGIRFKGVEKTNVEEYCVSEGWVRVTAGQRQGPLRQSPDDQGPRAGRTVFSRQGHDLSTLVIARSVATKQSILSACDAAMDCFAEFTIGRAFARPGGSQ